MISKYFKPKSLTFWAGCVPLIGGVIVALSSAIAPLIPVASVINELTGNMEASTMIMWGAGLVGLRAAPGMS